MVLLSSPNSSTQVNSSSILCCRSATSDGSLKINDRKFKITVSNGYRLDGRKISKAKTITVPDSVSKRGIGQYVAHAAEEFERYVKNGFGEDAETPFQKYAEAWLNRQIKYAPSTLASYRRMLDRIYPFIGQIPLCKLRPIALENMMNELRQHESRGKKIQEATVQKYLTVVSAVLSDAKRNEIIQKNPARMIDLPMTEQRMQIIPSPQEAQEILSALYEEPFLYRVYYFLAIYTGCRRGELAALRWSDFAVNGNDAILTVRHSRSIVAGQGVTEGSTKNGKARQIYIEPDVLDILKGLYFERSQYIDEYLFVNEDGNLNVHSLRHTTASLLIAGGTDVTTVAGLLGHSQPSTTLNIYSHAFDKNKKNASRRMQASIEV